MEKQEYVEQNTSLWEKLTCQLELGILKPRLTEKPNCITKLFTSMAKKVHVKVVHEHI